MKTTLIGLIVFFSMTTLAAAKNRKEAVNCSRQSAALSVSGHFTDWNLPLRADKRSGYYYGITNDSKNLYLEVKIKNRALIARTISLGFNVWIDPSGKGKEVLGINYPQSRMNQLMNHHGHHRQAQQSEQQLTPAQIKQRREEMMEKFNLRFLTGQETGNLVNFEKEGFKNAFFGPGDINAIVQVNQKGVIVYEAVIPLKSIFRKTASYLSKDKAFSLILSTGSYQPPASATSMYSGINGGENTRQMEGENFGGGGYMGQGIGGEGGGMRQWGGFQEGLEPVRLKLKRVVLFQFK